uniref:Phosphatase and actin regulator 3b n=1 Tax=Poecilia latipinna TaxID=48699 RepID=A0A3B3UFL1_9TELE
MDQQRALHSGGLVSGIRTPPVRRNSKLASLGRIFKPWKWRKKKSEKPRPPGVAEKKAAVRQKRDELVKRSPGEMETGAKPEINLPPSPSPSMHTNSSRLITVYLLSHMMPNCAPPVPVKKSPATLPRNFTLPKEPHGSLLRGRISTPTGSPHLGALHQPLPPSCIIEELHRALATKHRQESFQTKEARCSPKRRADGRLSRTSSMERESLGEMDGKKRSDENKENCRLDQYTNDQDSWNESVISGTLPRRMRKELLAVKLRNRPSKQELEDRNIFPVRSDQERQEIRQQIEMKLAGSPWTGRQSVAGTQIFINQKLSNATNLCRSRLCGIKNLCFSKTSLLFKICSYDFFFIYNWAAPY